MVYGHDRRIELVLEVVFDDYRLDHRAVGVEHRADRLYCARYGRMHRCGYCGRGGADRLPHENMVADGNDRLAGSADMHGHREYDLLRQGQLLYWFLMCERLVIVRVDAALVGLGHNITSM